MAKYPLSVAGVADFPNRPDGSVIYGQHVNALQDEVMAIESILGPGDSATSGVWSLLDAPDAKTYGTLVERLTDYSLRIKAAEDHVAASTNVHGVGVDSAVVGTNTPQTLTNKTLSNPTLTGTVSATGVTVTGNITFAHDVTILGTLNLAQPPIITDFSSSRHSHLDDKGGGTLTVAAIPGLQATLDGKAPVSHTHTRSQITDLAGMALESFSGNLPSTRVTGLGTGALMSVPVTANAAATTTQLVRGDDPRLKDARTPTKHASSHAAGGTDPISPAALGAASASHTHLYSAITNLASFPLANFSGNIAQSRVTNLTSDLANKLPLHGTADNSALIGGKRITVSASAPGGTPRAGDIWVVS